MAKEPKKTISKADQKWSPSVGQHGYSMLPNILFRYASELGINAPQQAVLFHLLAFWWDADRPPEVSKDRLATRLGISSRQVQRHLQELRKLGIIEVYKSEKPGRHPNQYKFDSLVKTLQKYAQDYRRDQKRQEYERSKTAKRFGA
jgi:biotin operon repressor